MIECFQKGFFFFSKGTFSTRKFADVRIDYETLWPWKSEGGITTNNHPSARLFLRRDISKSFRRLQRDRFEIDDWCRERNTK